MLSAPPPPQTWIFAEDLIPREVRQGWGGLQIDRSVQGKPLQIGKERFAKGLGTHADSSITFCVGGRCARMQASVGIDGEMAEYPRASVVFQVYLDGRKAFDSGVMRAKDSAKKVDLDLRHTVELRLVVTDAGDGNYADHADWGGLRFLCVPAVAAKRWAGPSVQKKGLRVSFADQAGGLSSELDGSRYSIRTGPEGAVPIGRPVVAQGVVRQRFRCSNQREVRQTQSLRRQGDAIAWTVTIEGDGIPFSAPIDTAIEPQGSFSVWMAGARKSEWADPMGFWKPERELFSYGNRFDHPKGISLPLACFAPTGSRRGLLLAMSPEDALLAMDVATTPAGARFTRTMHRLQKGKPVTFHMHLVPIASESRAALSWMVASYPAYFDPPNPRAHEVGGLGAYSGYEGPLDAAKYRAMGFKVNWKASIDFPYMGMFLPPVAADVKWNRFAGGGGGGYGPGDEGRFGQTSISQLEDYNRRMRADGFEVLNYFNVTEFGGNIADPPTRPATGRWQDPQEFLFGAFPKAILRDPMPIWTWGGAVILDCGESNYRRFLLDQARRHVKELPSSAGICIDRTDWLDRVNPHADDGAAWSHGPVRSLLNSWRSLMGELGPMMHKADKVIFVNDLIRRLDIMRYVDGVYDEFGYDGSNLNTTAFLCLRKPHIAWTANEDQLKPDPDAFMQRHLYMGAFPTAPVAANDHTIVPSAWADAQYLAYGPLFRALQGRRWDLRRGLVGAAGAKVNLFSVPGGWVAPIIFAGKGESIGVRLSPSLTRGRRVEAIRPEDKAWAPLKADKAGRWIVPIRHGCAMLRMIGASLR